MNGGKCLDASDATGASTRHTRGMVRMISCDTNNKDQHWTYTATTGQIKAKEGGCLDASERSGVDGGKVHIWSCDIYNKNQQWFIGHIGITGTGRFMTTDLTSEYSKIRFNIDPNNDFTGLRNRGLASSVQVAELTLYNGGTKLTGGVATDPGGNSSSAEGADKLIDGNIFTKWLDFNKKSVVIAFPQPVNVTGYSWATANDASERDPVKWSLEGSNDDNCT